VTPLPDVRGLTSKAGCVGFLRLLVNASHLGEPNHHRSAVQMLVNVFSGARPTSFPAVVPGAFILG
jgi:hypothetical protein